MNSKPFHLSLDFLNIPNKYLRESVIDKGIQTDIYQATLLHKEFAQSLNVVILVKTNLKTNARSHVILFSSDLELSYDKIIDVISHRNKEALLTMITLKTLL